MRYFTRRTGASLAALLTATAAITAHAQASPPIVMTEIPVTHSLVAQVMGDLGDPDLLLDRGADPHHFQLRPSQARALAQADLVVWMGPALTPWLTRTSETLSNAPALQLLATPATHLQPYASATLLAAGGTGPSHDHHAQDDHSHGDHGHHDGDIDPHAWLNPANARIWLSAIAAELAAIDPGNADAYQANAQAGQERITALEAELETILAPARETGIVVYHDAYGYLAASFGLNILGAVTLGDAATPGAARISAIRAGLEQAGAECIFPEANHPDAYVALITEGAALRVGQPLDPAGTLLEPGPELYNALMREMATTIADCAAGG